MSTYVIGDIQGCFAELQQLLKKIHFSETEDALWLVGDLVNRGPQSLEVLRWCKNFKGRLVCVLGNHDLHLLASALGIRSLKASDTLSQILAAPDCDELLHWLRQQPLLHHDESLNVVMAHAGIYPYWSLAQAKRYAHELEEILRADDYLKFLQHMYGDVPAHWDENLSSWPRYRFIVNAFTRMRVLNADGSLNLQFDSSLENIPLGCIPWFEKLLPAYQSLKLVFGHWAALQGVTNIPNVFALDTGCVWGKALTAMRLEDQAMFHVAAVANLKV